MTQEDWLGCADKLSLSSELRFACSGRKLLLFAVACLRRVWPMLGHEVIRLAVEVGEQYADGLVSRDHLCEIWTNAELDTNEGLWRESHSHSCHCSSCLFEMDLIDGWEEGEHISHGVQGAVANPSWTAANAAFHAREVVAWHAEPEQRAWAVDQERQAQYDLLLDILDGPARRRQLDPACLRWNDGTVVLIAQGIYCERRFEDLPILADALEEAGCDNTEILSHCRGTGPHVRGCWVLDLLRQQGSSSH